jgi:hypothetical protein
MLNIYVQIHTDLSIIIDIIFYLVFNLGLKSHSTKALWNFMENHKNQQHMKYCAVAKTLKGDGSKESF